MTQDETTSSLLQELAKCADLVWQIKEKIRAVDPSFPLEDVVTSWRILDDSIDEAPKILSGEKPYGE
jgi:hypothetical protein